MKGVNPEALVVDATRALSVLMDDSDTSRALMSMFKEYGKFTQKHMTVKEGSNPTERREGALYVSILFHHLVSCIIDDYIKMQVEEDFFSEISRHVKSDLEIDFNKDVSANV